MNVFADLHIHSKYSRACSKDLDLFNLEKYAKIKGLNLLGTGDFTHPKWVKHLKENLTEENGIYKTKTGFNFLLQTEISLIYSQDGKGRRVHNLVFAPNFDVVDQITEMLLKRGRVDYDGRPIFKIPCPEFVELLKQIDTRVEIIPAHCFTPHFSVFGEYNQFSKMEDAFQDQTKHIFAVETGLSADPEMCWRMSQLDKFSLVSFSDLHSFWPNKIGREATFFDLPKVSYDSVIKAMKTKEGLSMTLEVDPAFGKYHWDGHRKCHISFNPQQSLEHKKICPVCGKKLTIGVENRVEELASRPLGFKPKNVVPYKKVIPLTELISLVLNKGVLTKAVWDEYNQLIKNFSSELNILLSISKEELVKVTSEKLAEVIIKNRTGQVKIQPGYDGVYGIPLLDDSKVKVFENEKPLQKNLNDF